MLLDDGNFIHGLLFKKLKESAAKRNGKDWESKKGISVLLTPSLCEGKLYSIYAIQQKGFMGQQKWIVDFYIKTNGRCPTADFLDGLSAKEKVLIRRSLQRLEEYGTELGRPYVAPLRDHIWELRKETHQGNIRLLYFFFDGNKFIITHGFKKKSDKVPDNEIEMAISLKKDYFERFKRSE